MDRTLYGKMTPDLFYQPYRCALRNGAAAPGYALLADLQNTISPGGGVGAGAGVAASPGYGSLNGARARPDAGSGGHLDGYAARTASMERYDHRVPSSPTYQNQRVVHETVTTTTTSSSGRGGKGSSSLNNNLSELDTLLQDLSSARYSSASSYDQRRDASLVNGSVGAHPQRPPSAQDGARARPSVDSLLDELSAPNGDLAGPARPPPPAGGSHTTVHSVDYTTTTYGGSPASASASASGASTATKELDLLMASLADFKITASSHQHQTVTDSPYAKPNKATKSSPSPQPPPAAASPAPLVASAAPASHAAHPQPPAGSAPKQNQLDSMLGNLQADMSRQGVNTTQKGCCNACDKPIVGQVITALGKTWHPEHFTCNHCNQELGTRNFFERDGHPYCEPDYHNLFSPRCAYCNGPILDKCVTALEKTWHTEHFFCAQCGKQFGEEGFHEKDGKPYCRDDYFDMFAPKCGACNRPIMENYISALNSQWHADCFVCRDCRQPFHGGSFFDHEGLPYCETHYHAKRGSLCAGCHKPITGRCITAMFRKFHPEHFVCAFCLKQLNKGTFKEQNDKPYCHACFDKLFG
ncbi:hypothetical protein R5R35_006514 [Gryllus longicercus]|uniref:LIM zinc-binding domain-containing protein n=1 Tax=Gryllus longicercus TaxID=2509291 RepID=A0AAN9Z2Y8_9ORTH